jgi:ligand-binding SRPBCC domain-containing protein
MAGEVFEASVLVRAPVDDVFAFASSREGFERHFPYKVRWMDGPDQWGDGCELRFKFRYLGVWLNYVTKVVRFEMNKCFVDQMIAGPYKYFVHTHSFQPVNEGTLCTDRVEFGSGLGSWIDRHVALPQIRATFGQRHERMKAILESNERPRHLSVRQQLEQER